jgi:hypothetical protein
MLQDGKFKASLGYIVKPCLKNRKKEGSSITLKKKKKANKQTENSLLSFPSSQHSRDLTLGSLNPKGVLPS